MKKKIPLSIVIPTYNEEKRLKGSVEKILSDTKFNTDFDIEIIISDDGSTDRTIKIVYQIMSENIKKVRFIRHILNRGKGYAVKQGIIASSKPNILILDADLSVSHLEIYNVLNQRNITTKTPYMFVGQRVQVKKQPIYRIIVGKIFSVIVRKFLKIDFRDTQCPFKLLHNINKKNLQIYLDVDGFAYDVDLIKLIQKLKVEVLPITVSYYNSNDSKVTLIKTIKMIDELWYIKIKYENHCFPEP